MAKNSKNVDLQSDWQDTQLELLKILEGYKIQKRNDDVGSIDYVAEGDDGEKKLLRVMVDPDQRASSAYLNTINATLEKLEDGPYDEATILAKRLTKASRRTVREKDGLEYISFKKEHYNLYEVIEALQNLTQELCEMRCGKFPKIEEDCEGYQEGHYTCPVRRVSDDADFHIRMNWVKLMMNDFSRLVELRRQIKS